jgi:hypothetical protein
LFDERNWLVHTTVTVCGSTEMAPFKNFLDFLLFLAEPWGSRLRLA